MSTRPVGAAEFRNIQAELDALSAQVNRGDKNEEVGKKLETLQQCLDDVLFNGTGIEIDDMTQCQLQLDRVKSAFQRVLAVPSSTAAGGSPSSPKMIASSEPAPISSEKVFSVSATSSFSLGQPLQLQGNSCDKALSASLAKLSFELPSFTRPNAGSTFDRQFSSLNTEYSEGEAALSISRSAPTTMMTQRAQGPASPPPSPRKANKEVVKTNEQLLAPLKQSDFAIYYWVWMEKYSTKDFKQTIEFGTKRLTEVDLEKFKIHYDELKEKKEDGEFDFKRDFRHLYDLALKKCKEGSSDPFVPPSPAYAALLSFFVSQDYDALKSEQEMLCSKQLRGSHTPKQVVEANQAFLSLLWMKNPLCYYWTWFHSIDPDGTLFKEVTQSGTYLLSQDDKSDFEQAFQKIVGESATGKLDFPSRFRTYVQRFEKNPQDRLSKDPVFWELFKLHDLEAYNRAMESKTTHS